MQYTGACWSSTMCSLVLSISIKVKKKDLNAAQTL